MPSTVLAKGLTRGGGGGLSLDRGEDPPPHVRQAPALDCSVPRSRAKGRPVALRQRENLVQAPRESGLVALGKARQVPKRRRGGPGAPPRELREPPGGPAPR